jgi:DNA-binding CsgD family transcriptional regulator
MAVRNRRCNAGLLSRRMLQVLELLLQGKSEKEVAAALDVSRHTVHVYWKSLYLRFGVESRGELMARFVPDVRGEQLRELIALGRLLHHRATAAGWAALCAGTGRDAAGLSGANGGGNGRLRGHPRQPQFRTPSAGRGATKSTGRQRS